jgi:hypothetical protein
LARGWLAAIGTAATAVALLAGCGGDDETATTTVGGGEVTVSTTEGASEIEALRQMVSQLGEQVGLTDEVQRCFEQEFAAIPDAELQSYIDLLGEVSQEELQQRMLPLTNRISHACVPNRGPTIDENADPNQIALVREATKRQLDAAMRQQGVPEPIIACVVERVDSLSDAEVIEASNEPLKAARERFVGFVRDCR